MKILERKKNRIVFCFILLWTGVTLTAFGQPGDPGTDPDVPISGIEWLLLGGGIFGARRMYKNFRRH